MNTLSDTESLISEITSIADLFIWEYPRPKPNSANEPWVPFIPDSKINFRQH